MKPLLKWPGGKKWLLKSYSHMLPNPADIETYFEPFLGSAAVATHYIGKTTCVLSDTNARLIQMYDGVRDNPLGVIEELKHLAYDADTYHRVRELFNGPSDNTLRAAQLLYLNKTCFNGLYRENQRGEFNVPFGKYTNPLLCDEENIMAWSKAMNNHGTAFFSVDFDRLFAFAKPGCFFFLDPPYVPVSDTANFTAYTARGFGPEDQARLARGLSYIDRCGARFLLTNAAEAMPLYPGWPIAVASVARSINSKGDKRGKVDEILVTNYPVWNLGTYESQERETL
jgi:DNA adenine methylase